MITLTENVTLPDNTRRITVQVRSANVRVLLEDMHAPMYDPQLVTLAWHQLPDVELLANRFDTETVRTFAMLVTMLGRVHSNRQLYEVLL